MLIEVRAVPARALQQAAAIGARGDELGRVLLNRRHDDDRIPHERPRHLPHRLIRRTDLDVHRRLKFLNQDSLAKQRFDFGTHHNPVRACRARQSRLGRAPSSLHEVRAQPPPQVDRFADVERTSVLVANDIHARDRRCRTADSVAGPAPHFTPILDDERLGHQPVGQLFRRPANAQHFSGQTPIVRRLAHLPQARKQSVSQHEASIQSGRRAQGSGLRGAVEPSMSPKS